MGDLETSIQVKPAFSVRIVVCDHYSTKPTPGIDVIYSEFRGSDIKQVPVLRIFGSTPEGRKACLHVHGVFPYFYVPCPTPNPEPQFLYQIAASLDKALNIALKQATSSNQHVYKITLVKGLPFYGFHDKEHLYLKVFLYSPNLIKQAVELCANGAILGQTFQPHESHLNFTLQFFIDFNLFGMSNIDLQNVKFRRSGLSQNSNEPFEASEINLKPESMCFYEGDCVASHIINRQRIGKGDGVENPGLEEVWNQEKERRKQLNVSMASKSLSQGRIDTEQTDSHNKFEKMALIKLSGLIDKPIEASKEIEYPAESLEGTQLFNAVDVSVHLPDQSLYTTLPHNFRRSLDQTLTEDVDNTIVDETLALNSSLSFHYSQVQLDNDDLELLDMLQDMDERPIEEDSVMASQPEPERDSDIDLDDAEYSQVFRDETILLDNIESKDAIDADENSPSWHDSFWDGANIPQLDGTFDDDHVKKVRKRKMRPFKLGLSRPKSKKKENSEELNTESDNKTDIDESDEINASRDTIDSISELHLKRNVKKELSSVTENENDNSNESIMELVKKISSKHETNKLGVAELYDKRLDFEPQPGPSNIHMKTDVDRDFNVSLSDSFESTPENNKGIMSFYDTSKLFDLSLNDKTVDSLRTETESVLTIRDNDVNTLVMQENTRVLESSVINNESVIDRFNESTEQNTIDFRQLPTETTRLWLDTSSVLTPKIRPPTKNYIETTLQNYNIPKVKNPEPYFSNHKDFGDKIEVGHMLLKVQSKSARDQKPYEKVLNTTSIEEWRQLMFLQSNEIDEESAKPDALRNLLAGNKSYILTPLRKPPKYSDIAKWVQQKEHFKSQVDPIKDDTEISKHIDDLDNSQAIGLIEDEINSSISLESSDKKDNIDSTLQVTMQPDGSFLCFGNSEHQNQENSPEVATVEVDYLTIMVIEILASVRGDLHPDPAVDPILSIFVTVTNDCPDNSHLTKQLTEIIVVDDNPPPNYLDRCVFKHKVSYVKTENELLEAVIELIKLHDPDIMCGYEIEINSWGYFLERSQVLGLEIVKEVSRITEKYRQKKWRSEEKDFEGKIIGRIVFNVWRLFRYELALSSYSFENCMYEVLKERVPRYSYAQLYEWWNHESRMFRWIPVEYYLTRLSGTVRMLQKLDIINRTSELARLFGLQWWEVLSRGSQFRVESLMLRAARPLNLVALSPTVRQRAAMKAPECLPLIFEPESRFYADPVIVLDFQSLYPSMMIAYNYCFSTCIGRVQHINGEASYEFGAWRLRIPKSKLDTLIKNGLVNWSPVGVGFVKPTVRRGVLPALLRRILAARQAVKKGMKLQKDEGVKKAMHSRQLGLKLIANVTYGYTAANFSGRMPCVEVGDSVVAKGRETLERAIKLVRDGSWNAKVVYGDTDSMFVLVPGGTREEAFAIGQQIADAVTADNPSPVALKLEKVYQPCILQTKKRYVGFMYESAEQEKPVYEAKGIETVRRDGCPAGVKLLQRALCELFEHGDMSKVKKSVVATLCRLRDGLTPPRELMFTREYHGAAGYRPGASAPPNEIAKRIASRDRRAIPRTGERVAWQVCNGPPGAPLIKLAKTPEELIKEPGLTPHVAYYATRVLLPPLHRCLSLLGANVFKWWNDLGYNREIQQRTLQGGIAKYMCWRRCAICGAKGAQALCTNCMKDGGGQRAITVLAVRRHIQEEHLQACDMICRSCTGTDFYRCENTECPLLWRRIAARQKLNEINEINTYLPVQYTEEVRF